MHLSGWGAPMGSNVMHPLAYRGGAALGGRGYTHVGTWAHGHEGKWARGHIGTRANGHVPVGVGSGSGAVAGTGAEQVCRDVSPAGRRTLLIIICVSRALTSPMAPLLRSVLMARLGRGKGRGEGEMKGEGRGNEGQRRGRRRGNQDAASIVKTPQATGEGPHSHWPRKAGGALGAWLKGVNPATIARASGRRIAALHGDCGKGHFLFSA